MLYKQYNSNGDPTKALEFVQTPDVELDAGYSLQLKSDALAEGSEAAAMDFLRSTEMQAELVLFCNTMAVQSL